MRKKRVDPALVLWSAAIVLFAGAFFLGRATLRGPLLETQRTAPGSTAQDEWRSRVEEKAATAAEKSARVCLNTAAKEELLALPGVGEKTASAFSRTGTRMGNLSRSNSCWTSRGLERDCWNSCGHTSMWRKANENSGCR